MQIWITGGGTREPIDDVRYVGNSSTGSLAMQLATTALGRGHAVTLFMAESVALSATLTGAARLTVRRYVTSAELRRSLEDEPTVPDAVFHAAAVSDYAPVPLSGKVESGRASWNLEMVPLPKVAPIFRQRFPETVLVMFKLETGIESTELAARARRAAGNASANYVFANLVEHVGADHRGWLLEVSSTDPPEVALRGRAQVAAALIEAVEKSGGASVERGNG